MSRLFSSTSHKRSSSLLNYSEHGSCTDENAAYGSHTKRQKKTTTNERFDRMIDVMSIIPDYNSPDDRQHVTKDARKRRTSRTSNRAPENLPAPKNVSEDLSFIKMKTKSSEHEGARPSSVSSSSKGTSPSNLRTCGSLPSWLARTFLSLSKKHPLRLLLPPELAETTVEKPMPAANLVELVPGAIPETDNGALSCQIPEPAPATHAVDRSAKLPLIFASPAPACVESTAYVDFAIPHYNQPIPFSTPGPGTLLGSVTEPTAVSISARASSPTLYADDSWVDDQGDQDSEPIMPPYLSDVTEQSANLQHKESYPSSENYDGLARDDLSDNPHFQHIYAEPGPAHFVCIPIPLHFEDPTEDPLTSSPSSCGHQISYEDIDFKWRPFDRGKLTAPMMPDNIVFAYEPTDKTSLVQEGKDDLEHVLGSCETVNKEMLCSAAEPPATPTSPNPFRFVPPEDDGRCTVSKFPEQHIKETMPPKKRGFAPAPGIWISPLHNSRERVPFPMPGRLQLNSNASERQNVCTPSEIINDKNRQGRYSIIRDEIEDDNQEYFTQESHRSEDSIQSWGEDDV